MRRPQLPPDWNAKNRRRAELIRKDIHESLTPEEAAELAELQAYTADIVKRIDPFPTEPMEDMKRWLEEHPLPEEAPPPAEDAP